MEQVLGLEAIYEGLKKNLVEMGPKIKELEENAGKFRKLAKEYNEKLEKAENELKEAKDIEFALKSAMENLELIDVDTKKTEEKKPEVKVEEKKPEVKTEDKDICKPVKQLKWNHKNARLIQKDRYGKVIGNFITQKAAARSLGWDQSSISRFLKLSNDEQIRKKNFYFTWEF